MMSRSLTVMLLRSRSFVARSLNELNPLKLSKKRIFSQSYAAKESDRSAMALQRNRMLFFLFCVQYCVVSDVPDQRRKLMDAWLCYILWICSML